MQGLGIEMIGASSGHHADVFLDQCLIDFQVVQFCGLLLYSSVLTCIIVSKISHQQGHIKIEVEEGCGEGKLPVWVDACLLLPVLVVFPNPREVVYGECGNCRGEMANEWVHPADCNGPNGSRNPERSSGARVVSKQPSWANEWFLSGWPKGDCKSAQRGGIAFIQSGLP